LIAVPVEQTSQQSGFSAALLNPDLPIAMGIKGKAEKRYAVYRNNVTVSLVRAMEENFPAIRKLLGYEYFSGLAREFIKAHPPCSPLMFFYGSEFAMFLEMQSDLAEYPYLADVARTEQQWRLSYHEQDAPCLVPAELAGLSNDQLADLRLTPHPAFALLSSRYAVHSIFMANRSENAPQVVVVDEPEYVIIARPEFSVETRSVSLGSFTFLLSLSEGQSLGAAADRAFEVDPKLDLAICISTLLAVGAFQPIETSG
jgi:hypothetical protein